MPLLIFWAASRALLFGEWDHLVRDHSEDSTQCWVTILLNGRHLVRDHDVDQSSIGRLNLVLCGHSLGEWRRLVCYQEGTISPRLGLGMCDTLTLDQWACGLLQGSPWLRYPSTWSWCHTECEIKTLVTLLVYDDVLWMELKDHRGTWKKAKSKSQKYIRTFGSLEKDHR